MNQETSRILFAFLRSGMTGSKLDEDAQALYCPERLPKLLKIAEAHSIAHLLILGLKQNGLLPPENPELEKKLLKVVFQYERMQREQEKLYGILENAGIPFLPLKGAVLRSLYPEPWMRTSCDADILLQKEDAQKTADFLMNHHGYTFRSQSSHDIALITPGKLPVELHYDLIESKHSASSPEVLARVWDTATLRPGHSHHYEMTDEMFYFYHIAHMAKHFTEGGCGIRSFLDLWLLDNLPDADTQKRNALLQQGGLFAFADAARKLSRVWFGEEEHTSLSRQMEDFILQGGTFGSTKTMVAIQQQKRGGRAGYLLPKIFLPYEILKGHYPILVKHPWLTPVMEVRRWCKLIFCGHLKRTAREIQYNSQLPAEEEEKAYSLLKELGL